MLDMPLCGKCGVENLGAGNARHGHGKHMDKVVRVERLHHIFRDEGVINTGVLIRLEVLQTRLSDIHGGDCGAAEAGLRDGAEGGGFVVLVWGRKFSCTGEYFSGV